MEGIITLVVVIIVFNLINALIKGFRGDRSVEKRTTLAGTGQEGEVLVSPLKSERIDPFSGLDAFEEVPDPEPETETAISSKSGPPPQSYDYMQRADIKKAAKSLPNRPPTTELPGSVSMNLKRVLNQKEPLVAAFIFHEIFGPPLAQRRKR